MLCHLGQPVGSSILRIVVKYLKYYISFLLELVTKGFTVVFYWLSLLSFTGCIEWKQPILMKYFVKVVIGIMGIELGYKEISNRSRNVWCYTMNVL